MIDRIDVALSLRLRRLGQAAKSYQHAFELEKQASVIPQALAETFLELPDYPVR